MPAKAGHALPAQSGEMVSRLWRESHVQWLPTPRLRHELEFPSILLLCSLTNTEGDAEEDDVQGPEENGDGDSNGLESRANEAVVKVGQVTVEEPVEGRTEAGDDTEGEGGYQAVGDSKGETNDRHLEASALSVV